MDELLEKNRLEWLREVEQEVERRNQTIHAIQTLIICNAFITGKRKVKWLKNEDEPIRL